MQSMENVGALLAHWQEQQPQQIALGKLKADPAYQPRDPRLAPFKERARLERESEDHIARLATHSAHGELEPLLVAQVAQVLYVVDGHHRLKAHKRASRRTAAVRILTVTAEQARMVSKLVNCSGAKLTMHAEQSRECAWQTLAYLTGYGRWGLPDRVSLRDFGDTYGTAHETVRRMLRKLSQVNRDDYTADACDAGTGWPQWKHVKGNAIRGRFADVAEDVRERHRDEKRAAKLAAMIDRDGTEAFLRSLAMLENEAVTAAAEQLTEALADDIADY